jgi:hypothetical protein
VVFIYKLGSKVTFALSAAGFTMDTVPPFNATCATGGVLNATIDSDTINEPADTPTPTPTPPPTQTPGTGDCCQCGSVMFPSCGLPVAGQCGPGCAPVFNAACAGGNCVTFTPPPTPTPTPTRTPTQTPIPADGVSGHIRYYSNGLDVDGVTVNLSGPLVGTLPLTTGVLGSGYYRHYCTIDASTGPCVSLDPWHIRPQKLGDVGTAISVLDAVYILQSIAGLRTLTAEQQLAADVTGNGTVSVLDAVMILQIKAGLIHQFPVTTACGSDWAFVPQPSTGAATPFHAGGDQCVPGAIAVQPDPMTPADGEDFDGLVFGDVTGNWAPSATPTPNLPPALSALSLYRTYPGPGYPIQLAIGASDPDGDALTYAADTLPDGAQLDPATGVFSWMPTAEQLGPFYVPFSVSDAGQPSQSVQGELVFKVSPADPCTIATCDPANGCQSSLVPLTAHCCAGVALPRVAEPVSDCPGARVAFLGRNVVAGFGKLQNCDQLKVVNFGQIGAAVRFNLETRCLRVEDAPVSVHVRIETTSLVRGAIVDDSTVANMQPGDNGYAQRLGLTFPVQPPGPFFDLDGAEANVTVTVTDFDQVSFTQSVRLVLISDPTKDLSDLPETP